MLTVGVARLAAPAAADITPLSIADAISAPSLEMQDVTAAVRPDGSMVAYLACDPKKVKETQGSRFVSIRATGANYYSQGCDVFVQPTRNRPAQNIRGGKGENCVATRSPNGKLLAFLSTRDSTRAHLWVWEASTGKLRRVS